MVSLTGMACAVTVITLPMLLGLSTAWLAERITRLPEFTSVHLESSDTFTGRRAGIALTSPNDEFELALIQDGFGTSTVLQYCWAEVHDSDTGSHVTWREPCNPLKVQSCELALRGGFLLLHQVSVDSTIEEHLIETAGDGAVWVRLTDTGSLELVTTNHSTVWRASDEVPDDTYGQQPCKDVFHPSNGIGSGSRMRRFSWFSAGFSVAFFIGVLSS